MKKAKEAYQITWTFIVASIFSIALAGCGGGGGSSGNNIPAANTLTGVAAVGSPIVNGSISARCATGSPLTTTTDSSGSWQVTLASTHVLPCAVQVSGGTINNTSNILSYHSISTTPGTVNVTPLTDLMVANLAGTSTLDVWFTGLNTSTAPLTTITSANVDTTLTKLRTALNGLTQLGNINPITTVFTPTADNVSDNMLTVLQMAMTSSGITYTTLLSNAATTTFTAPAGLNTALTTAQTACDTPPATPTGVTVTQVGPSPSSLLYDNYITWSPVAGASYYEVFYGNPLSVSHPLDATHSAFKVPGCAYLPGCTDSMAGSSPFSIDHEYYAVKAVNSCGVRSALSVVTPAPAAVAPPPNPPTVSGISPSSGPVGTVVTITGTNFATTPINNTVTFNGTQATITAATTTSLTVTVPAGATTGTVSVATAVGTVSGGTFTVNTVSNMNTLSLSVPINGVANFTLDPPKFVQTKDIYGNLNSELTWAVTASTTLEYASVTESAFYKEIAVLIKIGGGYWSTNCGISGATAFSPSCASLGVTFDKITGTIRFQSSPIPIDTVFGAPSSESFTGTLHFTPY